eukprot:m.63950 g.63950  ORF g.63950 m.63950 type:complete len:477 (-) comp8189_c0_seq1:70-1500(-)
MMVDEAMQVEAGIDDMDDRAVDAATAGGPAAYVEPEMVASTTLDLDQYISAYKGHNRRRRLLFIAKKCPPLRIQALKTCLHDHKESGMLTTAALRVGLDLSDACAAAGRPQDDEPGPTEAQVQATTTALAAEHESLEATLKQARTQMVKESVRLGFTDVGNHLYKVGDFAGAMKAFQHCRDYSTSHAHTVDMCLSIIKVAIQLKNWTHVHTHVSKGLQVRTLGYDQPGLETQLHCADGLAHLASNDYELAAKAFLQANIEAFDLPELMSRRDVATYGSLCALATFSRTELKRRVLENTGFKEFLELYPEMREMVKAFAGSKYGACLKIMKAFQSELKLDCYLAEHVVFLYRKIREKMITQYFSSYSSVDLNKMAADFGCTPVELERELSDLIASDVIQARIDSDKQILHARQVNIRARTFRKAIEVGTSYKIHSQAVLLRAAMLKSNMQVGSMTSVQRGQGGRRPDSGDAAFDDMM